LAFGIDFLLETLELLLEGLQPVRGVLHSWLVRAQGHGSLLLVGSYLCCQGIVFSLSSGCLLSSLFEFALCCCRSTSRCLELGLQSLLIGCQREYLSFERGSLLFGLSE